MTYTQATKLLDERRAGEDFPAGRILEALKLTGDYQCDFNPSLAADMSGKPVSRGME